MSVKQGAVVRLLIKNSANQYVSVGSETGVKVSDAITMTERKTKDSEFTGVEPTFVKTTVSLNSLYVPSGEAHALLRAAARGRTAVTVQISEDAVAVQSGVGYISSRDLDAPADGDCTISATIEIDGEMSDV